MTDTIFNQIAAIVTSTYHNYKFIHTERGLTVELDAPISNTLRLRFDLAMNEVPGITRYYSSMAGGPMMMHVRAM